MNHGPAHDLNLLVLEEKEIDGKVINSKGGLFNLFSVKDQKEEVMKTISSKIK